MTHDKNHDGPSHPAHINVPPVIARPPESPTGKSSANDAVSTGVDAVTDTLREATSGPDQLTKAAEAPRTVTLEFSNGTITAHVEDYHVPIRVRRVVNFDTPAPSKIETHTIDGARITIVGKSDRGETSLISSCFLGYVIEMMNRAGSISHWKCNMRSPVARRNEQYLYNRVTDGSVESDNEIM